MKVVHHGSEKGELPDEWLMEEGMLNFSPRSDAYRVDLPRHQGKVFAVSLNDVSPVIRSPGVPIFKDDPETGRPVRERVVSILRGFRVEAAFPPVEVRCMPPGSEHKYELKAGAHRFYCSLAVGFASVPAVEAFDPSTLYK